MKTNIFLVMMGLIPFALLSACCSNVKPEDIRSSSIAMEFIDKNTNENFYPIKEPFPEYNAENLKIYDKDMNLMSLGVNKVDGNYYFSFSQFYDSSTDKIAYEQEIYKTYYLVLNEQDTDTLELCFKAQKVRCGGSNFSNMKIFYNGELNFEGKNNDTFHVDLKK